MTLSAVENEIIALKATTASLDGMLNHSLLRLRGKDPDSEVLFPDAAHQQLFNILLLDMLERSSEDLLGAPGSLLDALHGIAEAPQLVPGFEPASLRGAVQALGTWLNTEIVVDTWLPSLDQTADLRLRRLDFVYVCGNIGKHGIARLTGVAKRVQHILDHSGVAATREDALELLDRFYERFHDDILNYHTTSLAELLNNVRWSVDEYLTPEYNRSYQPDKPEDGRFVAPGEVRADFVVRMHWDLMAEVERKPFLRRFVGTGILKGRY